MAAARAEPTRRPRPRRNPTRAPARPAGTSRIEEYREEIARWREQHGDPAEALGAFLRDRFGAEALLESYWEYKPNKTSWRGVPWIESERSADRLWRCRRSAHPPARRAGEHPGPSARSAVLVVM